MTIDILNSSGMPPEMPGALCAETDPELFHPPVGGGSGEAARAKAICGGCDWRQKCAEWAIETQQPYGIWGGLTPKDRWKVRKGLVA